MKEEEVAEMARTTTAGELEEEETEAIEADIRAMIEVEEDREAETETLNRDHLAGRTKPE